MERDILHLQKVIMRPLMKTFLINAPILPDFGDYSYKLITTEQARDALSSGFISAAFYAWAADYLRDT